MGDYIVSNSRLSSIQDSYDSRKERLMSSFSTLDSAVSNLVSFDGFQGKASAEIKDYMSSTYSRLTGLMSELSKVIALQFSAYTGKYFALDGYHGAYISTKTMMDIKKKLDRNRETLENANKAVSYEEKKLKPGDVRYGYKQDKINSTLNKITDAENMLQTWTDSIVTIEESDILHEFDKLETLLTELESLLSYQAGLDPTKPLNRAEYQRRLSRVAVAYSEVVKELNDKEEQIKASAIALQEMKNEKALEEYEERKKKTAWIGFIVDAVCAVATVAATAALGPVGTIAVGALTGAVKSAVHEGLDQYAETGASWGDLDWGRIAIKGAVGGATGALTSAIGVGAGQLSSAIGGIQSAFGQGVAKIGLSMGQNMLNKGVEHLGAGAETLLMSKFIEGKDWSTAWDEAGQVFTQDLGKDMLIAAETGFTSHLSSAITGGMDAGFGKSILKGTIDGGVGMADYAFETLVDDKKSFNMTDMLATGGKKATGSLVKSGFSDLKSDHCSLKQWEEKQNGFTVYATDILIGGASAGLAEASGGFVSDLIKGDSLGDAARNFLPVDKNGMPSSALNKFVEGGADAFGDTLHARNFAEGVVKSEELSDKEFEKQYGRPREEGEKATKTVEYYKDNKKIVTYTRETTTEEGNGTTTVRTTSDVYEKGERIGGGESRKETTRYNWPGSQTRESESSSLHYTRKDGTRIYESGGYSSTKHWEDPENEVKVGGSTRTETSAKGDVLEKKTDTVKSYGKEETKTTTTETGHRGNSKVTEQTKTSKDNGLGGKDTHSESKTTETDRKGRVTTTTKQSDTSEREWGTHKTEKTTTYSTDKHTASETKTVSYESKDPQAHGYSKTTTKDYTLGKDNIPKKIEQTDTVSKTDHGKTVSSSTETTTKQIGKDEKNGEARFKVTDVDEETKTQYKTTSKKSTDPLSAAKKAASRAGGSYKPSGTGEDLLKDSGEQAKEAINKKYQFGLGIPTADDLGLNAI